MTELGSLRVDLTFLLNRGVQARVLGGALVFAIAGFVYGTFATKSYRSTMTVVAAGQQRQGAASILGSLGGLAAAFDGGGADASRIAAVLQSAAVTDAVIQKFDLKTRYKVDYQELARNAVWKRCSVKALPKPNMVQMSCDDEDPRLAQAMLFHFAEIGNQAFRRVSVGSASEEVRFLERRVAELRQNAEDAAAKMSRFQESKQIVDLDTQARALVTSVASLTGQRIAKQMELDYARTYSSPEEATARQLASQLSIMDDQLRDLEEPKEPGPKDRGSPSRDLAQARHGMFPAALEVPKLRAEYERLFRDRKVAEATLVFALERLEGAKANEARDVSTFQVLDPPTMPDRHSSPRRSETTLMFALVGLVGAAAFEWRRSRRKSAS